MSRLLIYFHHICTHARMHKNTFNSSQIPDEISNFYRIDEVVVSEESSNLFVFSQLHLFYLEISWVFYYALFGCCCVFYAITTHTIVVKFSSSLHFFSFVFLFYLRITHTAINIIIIIHSIHNSLPFSSTLLFAFAKNFENFLSLVPTKKITSLRNFLLFPPKFLTVPQFI